MERFKTFLNEAATDIRAINRSDQLKLGKAIVLPYTVGKSTKSTTTIIIRGPKDDRGQLKKDVEARLKKANIKHSAIRGGGSTGQTEVPFKTHKIRITYKPLSGGMSETTLNSTITELAPAIAFMSGQKFTSVERLYDYMKKNIKKDYGVYVNKKDADAGRAFIESFPSSSKYKEKMENALAVGKYLDELHKGSPIKQVYWGYRAKPPGIPSSHKGDLFVEFKTGEMLGVSLKAGGDKTREPQLNTYVNKFFDDIGYTKDKDNLISNVYNQTHKSFGLPKDWMARSQKNKSIDTIEAAKEKDLKNYEAKYDQMLETIRDSLIDAVNKDRQSTIDYIVKQVLKKDENVPLVVVKAIGTKYKMVTDEDALDAHLPTVTSIKAYKSDSSKQNWFIDLVGSNTVTMNMSVRSNKPLPDNKIAQGYNLAIKFNGI